MCKEVNSAPPPAASQPRRRQLNGESECQKPPAVFSHQRRTSPKLWGAHVSLVAHNAQFIFILTTDATVSLRSSGRSNSCALSLRKVAIKGRSAKRKELCPEQREREPSKPTRDISENVDELSAAAAASASASRGRFAGKPFGSRRRCRR